MANFDSIREGYFLLEDNWDLVTKLLPLIHHKEKDRYKYFHAVYIENKEFSPVFAYCISELPDGEELGIRNVFIDCLKHYKPQSFYDLLVFVDVYRECSVNHDIHMKQIYSELGSYSDVKILDEILCYSKGALLWDFQLDHLINFFYSEISKMRRFYDLLNVLDIVVGFRRGINAGKLLFIELSQKLFIDDKLSLYDVLAKRMVLGKTVRANTEGSFSVYKLLSQ